MGISGACRREELCKMQLQDIEFKTTLITITIPQTKTDNSRTFVIIKPEWIALIRQYANLRPDNQQRFFLTYRNGKCVCSPVGLNTIGKIPMRIAEYLQLDSATNYTGHCFRRSSATLLANQGGDLLSIKRHGGWKSSTVAEGYVENSLHSRIQLAKKMTQLEMSNPPVTCSTSEIQQDLSSSNTINVNLPSQSRSIEANQLIPGVSITGCENCTIKIFNNCSVSISEKN